MIKDLFLTKWLELYCLVNFMSSRLATTGIKLLSLIIDFLVKLGKDFQLKFYAAFSSENF